MPNRDTIAWGALVLAAVLLLRLPAFWTPILDVDEAQFAGYADWLLHGGLPYVSSVDTKPLGIYWFFAAVFAIFGRNDMIAVHVVTAFWVAATALFCYLIARDLGSRRAGFFAALFYAVFTTTYVPKFISTSIVVVMMLPLSASVYCVLLWERTRRMRWMLVAGLLWGAACLFKYQAGINLFVVAGYLMIARPLMLRGSGVRWKETLVFLGGGAAVGGLFALYLLSIGVWDDFVFWSFRGSAAYIEAGARLIGFWKNLGVRGGLFVASSLLVWILAGISVARFVRGRSKFSAAEYLVPIWLALSLVAVCTGGKFYGHYFIQLLPPLCIMAGLAAARLRRGWLVAVAAGMIIPAAGFFGARLYAGKIYDALGEEDPNSYRPIAERVEAITEEGDTIFVWGFATPVYYFSDRLGASRFLWCDWLTGRAPGTPQAKDPEFDTTEFITAGSWEMLFEDFEINEPAVIVDTSPGDHHDYGKYPIDSYPKLRDYLKSHYRLVERVDGADIYERLR